MNNLLQFEECKVKGYPPRTRKNASADVTLAFAVNFTTPGEKLTHKEVINQGKLYIPIDLLSREFLKQDFLDSVAEKINSLNKTEITINIAGNTVTRFKFIDPQGSIDRIVYNFLNELNNNDVAKFKIVQIRSGGQTGADEAGIKAALKLNIPALVYSAKGWLFRTSDGNDIADEKLFKERFDEIY